MTWVPEAWTLPPAEQPPWAAELVEVVAAECSDLTECSCMPGCPIPFAALDAVPLGATHAPTRQ